MMAFVTVRITAPTPTHATTPILATHPVSLRQDVRPAPIQTELEAPMPTTPTAMACVTAVISAPTPALATTMDLFTPMRHAIFQGLAKLVAVGRQWMGTPTMTGCVTMLTIVPTPVR